MVRPVRTATSAAITHGVPVVTQDDNYADVPGLVVVRV